mmetsp:Transcript_88172/g.248082  ORF Transcript_88172/g.248082 Transcript_88172/m.248082 type:complete len:249 (+) Transcript_88172:407-1153(+)
MRRETESTRGTSPPRPRASSHRVHAARAASPQTSCWPSDESPTAAGQPHNSNSLRRSVTCSPRRGGPPSFSSTPWMYAPLFMMRVSSSSTYTSAVMASNCSSNCLRRSMLTRMASSRLAFSSATFLACLSSSARLSAASTKVDSRSTSWVETCCSNHFQKSMKSTLCWPSGIGRSPSKSFGILSTKAPPSPQVSSKRRSIAGMLCSSISPASEAACIASQTSSISPRRRKRQRRPRSIPASSANCRYI